jgi:anti-sigma factor RsiW
MKCRDVEKMLSAYSDGESSAERKTLIESHVRSCASCSRILEEDRILWKALGESPSAKASPFFYTRIKAKLRAEESAPRPSAWTERLLIPASALAIAVLGFWLGTIAGGNGDAQNQEATVQNPVASASYLDTFNSVPSASFGEVYFAMAGQE